MANLRTAMDAAFWDFNVASPQSLDGSAKLVPGDPAPPDGAVASRALRFQQLSFLRNGFPLGIIPSYSPTPRKELGSFSLQSLLLRPATANWWLGVVGQFRPKKLIDSIKAEISSVDEWELSALKDVAKHFLDKSLYSLGVCSQLSLSPSSSVLIGTEQLGEKERRRHKLMLFHKLPNHDITMEAAWPGLFLDHNGRYWDVPESISLDLLSLVSESGFRYRFGIHKNGGHPHTSDATNAEPPSALKPGLCAKAAFSYEKSKDFWRQKETKEDVIVKTEKGSFWRPSYDLRLREPHSAVSAIIGGICTAWLWNPEFPLAVEPREGGIFPVASAKRGPFSADLFGSVCYTFQHGNFRKKYGDLTRIDARLDISSASALAQRVFNVLSGSSGSSFPRPSSSPRVNLIFQQQGQSCSV
ncbi:hypothetical protein BT93_L4083 [Corymbia citriodora subsp. variegata]|uniref:Protein TRIGALACTOSYLDIACYLGLYCEROL 4, chloroplastic n=1 Tax=Corymbia citriodora subsp. variegata TaxID=360336 RepID=A0A8T0CUQ1_CORYI|nr:hypothetical protein BT93_L4083 [Corymbia citriodora subsp. variegata]